MTAPVLVALDVPRLAEAMELAERVIDHVAGFKVGLELMLGGEPDVVATVGRLGRPVFADAKLHDIPNTVRGAARQLGAAGARWVTVHAAGGRAMVEAAVEGLAEGAGDRRAGVLAVSVLTSMTPHDLVDVGLMGPMDSAVERLARLASVAGAEGVVCSVHELDVIGRASPELATVVPGIRVGSDARDDQSRVATPAEAIARGAHLLVIGRSITRAEDPRRAAQSIARSIVDRPGGAR